MQKLVIGKNIFKTLKASKESKTTSTSKQPKKVAKPIKDLIPELLTNAYPKTVFDKEHLDTKYEDMGVTIKNWTVWWESGPSVESVKATLKAGITTPRPIFEDESDYFETVNPSVKIRLLQFQPNEMPCLSIGEFGSQKDRVASIEKSLVENFPKTAFTVTPIKTPSKALDIVSIHWENSETEDQIRESLAHLENGVTVKNILIRTVSSEEILSVMKQLYMRASIDGEEYNTEDLQAIALQLINGEVGE